MAAFHSFAHLLGRIFVRWYTFLGTSPGGITAQIVILALTEVQGGWRRLRAWRESWKGGPKRAALAFGAVWVVVLMGCVVTTVYDDHQELVAANKQLKTENSQLKNAPPTLTLASTPKEAVKPHWKDVGFSIEKSKPPAPDHLIVWVYSLYDTIDPPIRMKITCTDVMGITDIHMTVGSQEVVNPTWKIIEKEKVVEVQFAGPALNMFNMLSVELYSTETQLKVLKVENWSK